MKRINDNEIAITQEELDSMQSFIRSALASDWDRHTNHYMSMTDDETGMRRMDPDMYDMAAQMAII